MANGQPRNFVEYLTQLPIPWLTSREVGKKDATAQGQIYDQQVDLAKAAVRARFPDYAPADALPYQGQDRKLIQGHNETDEIFRTRLKAAWDQWALAGIWAEVLFQLFWSAGLSTGSTWIVQQNGYAYNLSADPGPTDDPIALLQVTPVGDNQTITYPDPVPWWTFNLREDLCTQFAVIISGPMPPTMQPRARAVFDGTTNKVTARWSGPFDDANYKMLVSRPTTTDGTVPTASADLSSRTKTTVDVQASAPFIGYVDLLGFSGDDPFLSPSLTTLNVIRRVVKTWKPAKALFKGIWVVVEGAVWGWPLGVKWGDPGLKWGEAGRGQHYEP